MTDYRVVIPPERYTVIQWRQEKMPGVGAINRALESFEPKIVFAWHLSIMIQLQDLARQGMPTRVERAMIDRYGDYLYRKLKGAKKKPNGLFLARLTWNGTRELIYRIYDPEVTDKFLKREIESTKLEREFDYKMEYDPTWKLAGWHINATRKRPNKSPEPTSCAVTPRAKESKSKR